MPLEYRCDGVDDCGDFTDESICRTLVMTKCDDGDGDERDLRLELR